MDREPKDTPVYSADGKVVGKTTGGEYPCRMEGCRGTRLGVRWPDGKITYPCSNGMNFTRKGWRIIG